VCVHFCVYMCLCICVFMYACVYMWMYVCLCVCPCICMCIHMCMCCMCVYVYAFVCACVYMCVRVYICVHMCMCIHVCDVCLCVCAGVAYPITTFKTYLLRDRNLIFFVLFNMSITVWDFLIFEDRSLWVCTFPSPHFVNHGGSEVLPCFLPGMWTYHCHRLWQKTHSSQVKDEGQVR
jgi:hypothetical protein